MKKRGVSGAFMWVSIVIGLIVILSIGTVLYQGRDYLSEKIFGKKYISAEEEEFVPYEVEVEGELKTADDSMKALVCAFNSLAIEKKGWLIEGVCPEGFYSKELEEKKKKEAEEKKKAEEKKTEPKPAPTGAMVSVTGAVTKEECDGALYGQTCVECRESEFGMKTITLPESEYDATKMLTKAAVKCWNDFKGPIGEEGEKNIFCNKVVIPGTAPAWVITKDEFREHLKKFKGAVGSDLAGLGITGTQNVDWKFGEAIVLNIKQEFYICANYEGVDEVFFTRNLNDCEVETRGLAEKEFTCEIKTFELPQEIGSDVNIYDWAIDFIKEYKDPELIMYYESFPTGEDASWQIDKSSFFIDVIFFGAAMNVIPVLGMGLAKGVKGAKVVGVGAFDKIFRRQVSKEVAEETTEKLLARTGKELGEELGEAGSKELIQIMGSGYEYALKSQMFYDDIVREVGEEAAEKARETFLSKYALYKSLGKTNKEIAEAVIKDMPENVAEKFGKNVDEIIKKPMKELTESFNRQQTVKQFFAKYLMEETGEKLNKEALEKMISEVAGKELYDKLSPEITEELMKRTAGYFDEIADVAASTDDILKTTSLTGRTQNAFVTYAKKEFNAVADSLLTFNKDTLSRFLFGVTPKEIGEAVAKKGGKLSTIKAAVLRYNPIHISIGRGRFIPIPRPLLVRSLLGTGYKTTRTGVRFTSDAAAAAWHSRVARYTLAYLIATQIAEADAQNIKNKKYGGNTLALQEPYSFTSVKKYELSDDTTDYYLNLFKYKGASSRFFLASPCKTDLTVTKTDCSCVIHNGAYILSFEKEKEYYDQPFDPGSVEFKREPRTKYAFDKLNSKEQEIQMQGCRFNDKEYGRACSRVIAKNPEVYEKFVKYVYDKVYVPAINFIQKDDVSTKLYNIVRQRGGSIGDLPGSIQQFSNEYFKKYENDPNFGALLMFSNVPHVPPAEFVQLLSESKTPLKLRSKPVSFDEFKKQFSSAVYTMFYAKDPVHYIYNKMYVINTKNRNLWFTDLFDKDNFLYAGARHTYLNYHRSWKGSVDTTKIVKLCESAERDRTTTNVFGDFAMSGRFSTTCFDAQANLAPYEDYNNGNNFCFSGDHSDIEIAKELFAGLALAIDLGVGVTGVTLLVEAPVAVITGAGAAWAARELDKTKYWPNH